MRVLLASSNYPPDIGGPSLQTKQIALHLHRLGIDVHVVALRRAGSQPTDAFNVHFIDPNAAPRRDRFSRKVVMYRTIERLLDQVQPDVVHMQTASLSMAPFVGLACRRRRIPTLLKHASDLVWVKLNRNQMQSTEYSPTLHASWRGRALKTVAIWMLRQYSLIWATSPFVRQSLIDVYGIDERRIVSMPNLIDLCRFDNPAPLEPASSSPRPLTILIVSRLTPFKGVDVGIRALPLLCRPDVRLRIVGSGRVEAELRQMAATLGVTDRVEFAGEVAPERIHHEYARADIFALPSRYEPFGIVLVEAMAAGLPVVASRTGGIPDVLEGGNVGLLTPVGDEQALAAALNTLLVNPELRARMGAAGRRRALHFDLGRRITDLVDVYQSLCSSRVAAAQ